MISLEIIKAQINRLFGRKKTIRGEIPRLTDDILWDTEKVDKIVEASDDNGFLRGSIILTDQRLISFLKICLISGGNFFIKKKKCMIEVNEFKFKEIADVYPEGFGKVTIEMIKYNRRFSFILADKSRDRDLCDYIDSKLLRTMK